MRLILSLLCLLAVTTFAQQSADAPVITIIHTNDTHSQFDAARVKGSNRLEGGVVQRAAILELFRQQDPDLLYFDAGDMVQGSPYFNIFKGELEVLCMNQQRLVASTFGNHEFDNGLDGIAKMLDLADFPIISANYHCEGTVLETRILPHLILVNHGVKVGVTGVTCDPEGLITTRNWQGIRYEDPITAANREARLLREEGCDLVVVLSHAGFMFSPDPSRDRFLDTDIAKASTDIDLIIGAHTHINIERGIKVDNAAGHPVLITQTGGKANPMGYLQVFMKQGSPYAGCQYSVDSIVCKKIHPDDYNLTGLGKDLEDLVAPYSESLADQMNITLAHAPLTLEKANVQSTLGNFTTDALIQIGEQYTGKPIDVSIMNVGGLRSDLAAGDVTIGTLFRIFPFENAVVVLELKGDLLQKLINSNAGRKLDGWSGTQITLAMDGDRCYASDILVGGKPIDPERNYRICTIDYLAEGNGGMSALTQCDDIVKTGVTIRDAMIDYVRSLGQQGKEVVATLDDRVIDHTKQ